MNKAYKVIWSKVRGCYVVVSELAKERGKNNSRGKHALLAGIVMGTLLGGAFLPAGTVFAADPPAAPPANNIHYVAVGVDTSKAIEARDNQGDPETSAVNPAANYDFPQASTINFNQYRRGSKCMGERRCRYGIQNRGEGRICDRSRDRFQCAIKRRHRARLESVHKRFCR